jgi:purine-nucleoside/S-methyl-5'-thioadenosine phosphorylase / adenosine deaminase
LFIHPSWPAPASVRALCSTRVGGVSHAPYDSLNLGDHVGDRVEAVASNRELFARTLGARPVFLNQVHRRHTVELTSDTPDGVEADGCVTRAERVACTIMVADCLPVLLTTTDGCVVAAAHAGWRGLAGTDGQGILEAVWRRLRETAERPDAGQTMAWLGPCIGPDAFEVGPEVKSAFEAFDTAAAMLFKPHGKGKWLADLPGLARRRLRALGVTRVYGNDGGSDWCTASNPSRFFSHRRDGRSGRFAAGIWRV